MSLPRAYNLWFYQGNTATIAITLTEKPAGGVAAPKDLTGYTVSAQIRRDVNAALLAEFTVQIPDPTTGRLVMTLPAEATAKLVGDAIYDITTTSPTGVIRTWLNGEAHFVPRVSRTTGIS